MHRFGLVQRIYEEAAGGEADKGGGSGGETPKTVNINGKDVDIATLSSAMNLHNALADPEVGKEIIEQLARRTGLLDKNDDVKPNVTEKQLEGKVQKLLKQKFGKDYEKFADTLGPALDEAIQSYLEEHAAKVSGASAADSWSGAVEAFTENHQLTPEVEREMEKIITRNGGRPNLKGKEALEYLSDMYELAVKKTGGRVINDDDDTDSDDKDDKDNAPRRRTRKSERPDFREVARPKNPSIDDIVDAAMRGQRFK